MQDNGLLPSSPQRDMSPEMPHKADKLNEEEPTLLIKQCTFTPS